MPGASRRRTPHPRWHRVRGTAVRPLVMTLSPLYLEGLAQRALAGPAQLTLYKLGLIDAILKDTLRSEHGHDPEALRAAMQTALEISRWEPRRRPSP